MPQNMNVLRQLNRGKNPAAKVGARTRTVMRSGPNISGGFPDMDMNDDHMDKEMIFENLVEKMIEEDFGPYHEEYKAQYPDLTEHYKILKSSF